MKHRFFLDSKDLDKLEKDLSLIPNQELAHQLQHVLKLQNKQFIVFDQKYEYLVRYNGQKILIEDKKNAKKLILKENKSQLFLLQALPKVKIQKTILQKATELGVDGIYFWQSQYSIGRFDDFSTKRKRFEKIIKEAVEQSGGNDLPLLNYYRKIDDLDFFTPNDLIILAYENSTNSLLPVLRDLKKFSRIFLIIGPEGGFSEIEVSYFNENFNTKVVSLGEKILRVETAVIALLANVKLFL